MKKLFSLLILVVSCFNVYGFHEILNLEKIFTFNYNCKEGDKLEIINKFGDVKFKSWDKDKIYIKVTITVTSSSEEKALKLLNLIDIDSSKVGNKVILKTDFSKFRTKSNSNNEFRINYQVYLPSYIAISIDNSFGDIFIPNYTSEVDVSSNYGTLYAENLKNLENKVELQYGKGYIKSLSGGTLNSAYSKLNLDNLSDILISNSYGSLESKAASNIKGKLSYSDLNIDDFSGFLELQTKYLGNFNVRGDSKFIKGIKVNNNYSELDFEIVNPSFNFDIETSYSKLIFVSKSGLEYKKNTLNEGKNSPNNFFIGKVGKGSGLFNVAISSSYGNIIFK